MAALLGYYDITACTCVSIQSYQSDQLLVSLMILRQSLMATNISVIPSNLIIATSWYSNIECKWYNACFMLPLKSEKINIL